MSLVNGETLGRYEIQGLLGAGGMGEVYRARDPRLNRDVAIKVLAGQADELSLTRFRREAHAVAGLNHPHICAIYDIGEDRSRPYLVMELLDGETLQTRLTRGPLPIAEVVERGIAIAEGLELAHEKGLIHRDIKPSNIFLTSRGETKLLDFGLARASGPSDETTHLDEARTGPGGAAGTVAYMSPEQLRGEALDRRTDLFSLGLVLCEMSTGCRPFGGTTIHAIAASILSSAPTDPQTLRGNLPTELSRLILKALEKDREDRYQTAAEIRADLRRMMRTLLPESAGSPPLHRIEGRTPTARRPVRSRLAIGLGVLFVLAVAVIGWWARQARPSRDGLGGTRQLPSRTLRRLTFDAGLQTDVTWAPDGRSIAYASDRAGNFDIWIQPIEGGSPIQLTRSGDHDRQPSWSPDGNTIIYRSDRGDGGLFAISAKGGAERQLTSFGFRPKWSPDGSRILFVKSEFYATRPELFTLRLDDPTPRPILDAFLQTMSVVRSWNWFPDSNRVSISGRVAGTKLAGIYTVNLAGTAPVFLENSGEIGEWDEFHWSPSGEVLFVDCGMAEAARGVCRITVDLKTMKAVAAQRIAGGNEYQATPVLSADGKQLAITIGRLSSRLWSYRLDPTTGRIMDGGEPLTDPEVHVLHSALSASGNTLAYMIGRAGSSRRELWIADLAARKHRQISNDDQLREAVRWSRDGTMLAYRWAQRTPAGTLTQALAINRVSDQQEQLVSVPQVAKRELVYPSDWSPDGSSVLASSVLPHPPDIALTTWPLHAAPGSQEPTRTLAWRAGMDLWGGTYSPDGRWVVFLGIERNKPDKPVVYVMSHAGRPAVDWTRVTADGTWTDKPVWSADGRLIYYQRLKGTFLNVWAQPFDSARGLTVGEPVQITTFGSARQFISTDFEVTDLNVARNRLVLPLMERTGNIWHLGSVDE